MALTTTPEAPPTLATLPTATHATHNSYFPYLHLHYLHSSALTRITRFAFRGLTTSCAKQAGGERRIRTSVGLRPADLQSAPFNRFGISPSTCPVASSPVASALISRSLHRPQFLARSALKNEHAHLDRQSLLGSGMNWMMKDEKPQNRVKNLMKNTNQTEYAWDRPRRSWRGDSNP